MFMVSLLVIIVIIGFIFEVISLLRDPAKVEFHYSLSTGLTETDEPAEIQCIIQNNSILPISYMAVKEIYPSVAAVPEDMINRISHDGIYTKFINRIGSRKRKKLVIQTTISKRGVYSFILAYNAF